MNLRIFLSGSSLVLLSWMAASYMKELPQTGFSHVQTKEDMVLNLVANEDAQAPELTAHQ